MSRTPARILGGPRSPSSLKVPRTLRMFLSKSMFACLSAMTAGLRDTLAALTPPHETRSRASNGHSPYEDRRWFNNWTLLNVIPSLNSDM
jgi:hypothetical protein